VGEDIVLYADGNPYRCTHALFPCGRTRKFGEQGSSAIFAAWCVARVEAPTPEVTGWRAWVRRLALAPHERVFLDA
jgi:hypothetical protein